MRWALIIMCSLLPIDNVHYQNAAQLVRALTEADIQFELQVIAPSTCRDSTV